MKEKKTKVKLRLTDGTESYDFAGKCVFAVITDPEGRDADTQMLALGNGSAFQIASAVGSGLAAFFENEAATNLQRVMLTAVVMEKLKEAIYGEPKEKKIFEGTMEEFMDGNN